MTELTLLPYVELLVVNFWRGQEEIEELVGDHVWTELPALRKGAEDDRFPAVRITRIGGAPAVQRPRWLDAAMLQIEAWGGPQSLARQILETGCAAMAERLPGSRDEGVVTHVTFGGVSYVPDATFDRPKPRYLTTCFVYLHPHPSVQGS